MALSVPLSRFTSRVGGGSAFFVRRIWPPSKKYAELADGHDPLQKIFAHIAPHRRHHDQFANAAQMQLRTPDCRREWGGGQRNPTIDEMRAALTELDTPDEEHPDTWLEDDSGRVVIAYESGLVIFADSRTEICRRQGVTRDEALQLWLLLQRGRHDEIRQRLSA